MSNFLEQIDNIILWIELNNDAIFQYLTCF